MKYVNADELIAAIEMRLKNTRDYMNGAGMKYKGPKFYKARGKESAYDALLSIIYFLQQEQPEVDLENYLENYFKGWHIKEEIGLTKPDGWSCIVDDLKSIARHFYELGLNSRKEE